VANRAHNVGDEISRRRLRRFQDLMRSRVQHILLVSSLYDSFILTEDGHLNEALMRQFVDLNLSHNPDLIRVSSGADALAMASEERRFDMIVTSMQLGDMNAAELARGARDAGMDIPIVLLAYNNRDLTDFLAKNDVSTLDRVFLWQGDVRILLAMVKYVEDRWNVAHDTGMMGVPAIIVVEDNIRFYSSFLPVIYAELMNHTHNLISEGLNLSQKMLRMRARPKVMLCDTFEEAWDYFSTFDEQILGIISDIEFPVGGRLDRRAGVELAARVRKVRPDIPIVLQSSIKENEELAQSLGAFFLLKGSPLLLHQLREVLIDSFGFGDFVFRSLEGDELDRAHDLRTLVKKLKSVPAESIAFHGERNHFSNWLKARTEFALAEKLRPRKVSDFETLELLREDLIQSISAYRLDRDKAVVADFDRNDFDISSNIFRIGGGSLGGKARGLAFVNRVLIEANVQAHFPEVSITVPSSVVLGTDIFDQFIEQNDLGDFAIGSTSDAEIENRFLVAPFPEETLQDLRAFLEHADYPLAVRSSGLFEDSPSQPFAGVYQTYMVPNRDEDVQKRLNELVTAVKRVYASTFSQRAKAFLRMTPFRLEEEKMAVIIQKIVGQHRGNRFYPDFSGVARSHNFYPTAPQKAEDGIAAVALGLGRAVVDGSNCVRFCPRYPRHLVAFSSVDDVLDNSQREFYALDLDRAPQQRGEEGSELTLYGLDVAEQDGSLDKLGSTYSPENDVVYDGISRPGVRLISFAPILKHQVFPLAELLEVLIDYGSQGTSSPVEIEFAVNLSGNGGSTPEFGFLQMRPLSLASEVEEVEIGKVMSSKLLCRSASVLGHGRVSDLRDLIVVDFHRYDRLRSREVAQHVARFNGILQNQGLPYLLVGVGRWGSADPHLGIPVTWNQIAGARVIVESGFRDFRVTPSQGTHFFQNLTSCNVGYFTVNPEAGEGFVDWDWLAAQTAEDETEFVRHVRLDGSVVVKMSGKTGEGVILKPADGESA
jgi:CheY-like chemotaxis protein